MTSGELDLFLLQSTPEHPQYNSFTNCFYCVGLHAIRIWLLIFNISDFSHRVINFQAFYNCIKLVFIIVSNSLYFLIFRKHSTDFQYFGLQSYWNLLAIVWKKRISQIYRTLPYRYSMSDTFKDCLLFTRLLTPLHIFRISCLPHLKILAVLGFYDLKKCMKKCMSSTTSKWGF